jgi:hypothetical protein
MVALGRTLSLDKRVWCGDEWAVGLSVNFEVFDRMDGLSLLSVCGPLGVDAFAVEGFTMLGVRPGPRVEVRGLPFSAASRDPTHRRFVSMHDFFQDGHLDQYPSSLCIRVTVLDRNRGRNVVVWEESKRTQRSASPPSEYWQQWLPQGSLDINPLTWQPLTCSVGAHLGLEARAYFIVCPEPDQLGVGHADRLYRLAGGDEATYDLHWSPIGVTFSTTESSKVATLVRSLLEGR